jgi:hypothetical protein
VVGEKTWFAYEQGHPTGIFQVQPSKLLESQLQERILMMKEKHIL